MRCCLHILADWGVQETTRKRLQTDKAQRNEKHIDYTNHALIILVRNLGPIDQLFDI